MKQQIALIGYSGHAYVVAEAVELMGYKLLGYYEKEVVRKNPFGLKYLGFEGDRENLRVLANGNNTFFVALGGNLLRRKLTHKLTSLGLQTITVAHPACIISSKSSVGTGSFIAVGAKVNALAEIGIGALLNSGCIIEHECKIGDFVHIAPGAILAGNVRVGENTFIGAGAVIKQGVSIGCNVTIGAGAVVLKDIPDNQTWIGNPAKQYIK